jgi:fructose-1,6-bisphosphatase/inositol monophosphatase family enzyme
VVTLRDLVAAVRRLHEQLRAAVIAAGERGAIGDLSRVANDAEGDTLYALDTVTEAPLVEFFERELAPRVPVALIAEGIPSGRLILPRGTSQADVRWHIIVDPIDGTRALMYQKRSGWILTGIAPNRGPATGLHDIEAAVQTEIPVGKQYLADVVWAIRGAGVQAERWNRLTDERTALTLWPSRAATLAHGFAMVARFFPGQRDVMAAIDDEIVAKVMGPPQAGKAACFEDQYPSTGGQLYELMAGHDRFVADIRPLVYDAASPIATLCCHPYDICTELIARELGVIVTDQRGQPLSAMLSVQPNVAWVGYANAQIRRLVEPALQHALRSRGLL